MPSRNRRSLLGFFLLACGVVGFRSDHGTFFGLVGSSVLVIAFWYLNGLKFAISSLRNLLVLAAVFGSVLIGARLLFPTVSDSAKIGSLEGSDLDPALIARLKGSHEIALQLYLDHRPTIDDRYYKVGSLPSTPDGFHYRRFNLKGHEELNSRLVPKAAEWTKRNLISGTLDGDLQQIETWFRGDFSYTLAPGTLRSEHPLDEFLFESRKGFCEHYAAALATLLKLRGDRAQVIVGYAGGSWNPLLRRLTFAESDAHAWVEVIDPATHRWRIVDPTDWVMSETVVSSHREWATWGALFELVLAAMVVIGVLIYFIGRHSDGLEAFLRKISKLEQKNQLDSLGLTVSERIARLAVIYPKGAQQMRQSLLIYYATYFQSEPTKTNKRLLYQSVTKW